MWCRGLLVEVLTMIHAVQLWQTFLLLMLSTPKSTRSNVDRGEDDDDADDGLEQEECCTAAESLPR